MRQPAAATVSSPGAPGLDATPIAVSTARDRPCRCDPPIALAPAAHPRATSSTGGTAAGPAAARPPAGGRRRRRAAALLLLHPSGATHLAPRVRPASPAARAKPVRERGRRGGAGGGGSHSPFDPDPISPLLVGSAAGGGGTGFVLLLTMALMAAVSLLDPAGWSMRVATATRSGRDRIVRRIDRPG